MKNMFCFLAAILFFAACSNSSTDTNTKEIRDTTVTRDSTDHTDNNVVTPPASNGQF